MANSRSDADGAYACGGGGLRLLPVVKANRSFSISHLTFFSCQLLAIFAKRSKEDVKIPQSSPFSFIMSRAIQQTASDFVQ